MSLKHILNTIQEKTQLEINNIKKETAKNIDEILLSAKETAEKKQKEIKIEIKKKAKNKINQTEKQAQRQIKNRFLQGKQVILRKIFDKACQKLAKQDNQIKKLYQLLLTDLKDKPGKIITSNEDLAIIKEIMKDLNLDQEIKVKLKQRGFKFITKKMEIDNRLKILINEIREEVSADVAKKLFEPLNND